MAGEYTIEYDFDHDKYKVYEWSVYSKNSVLAGQTMKRFVDWFDTEFAARQAHPTATVSTRSAHNTFSHLPSEADPVPGGMFPDDIDEGT
jgi:hypothetical protein